jgi:hypothetical protein
VEILISRWGKEFENSRINHWTSLNGNYTLEQLAVISPHQESQQLFYGRDQFFAVRLGKAGEAPNQPAVAVNQILVEIPAWTLPRRP